jgi:tetratricopeptide (TPR) repeat protein
MLSVTAPVMLLMLSLLSLTEAAGSFQEKPDTAIINKQTRNAYIEARRNPDISILIAHRSLGASRTLNYKKGIADASLALGMAYLARYNKGDSAHYYNMQALSLYEETGDVTGKGRACYGLAYVYSFKGDFVTSEKYSSLALQYFEEAGDHRGMLNSLSALSYLARQQQDLDKAKTYVERAISTARNVKDTLPLAEATNDLGNIYKEMALFSQAIDAYFEALRLWELKKDSGGMSIAYGSIGLAFYYQKDNDRALEYFNKHLALSEKRKDLWELSKVCNNIAQIYNSRNRYDSALIYQRRGIELNREMKLPSGESNACYNIASTFLHLKQTDSAYWYINRAIDIATGTDMPIPAEYYITLGNIYRTQGRYQRAVENSLKAYSLGKQKDLPLIVSDASLLLSEIYANIGHEDLAYRYFREHTQLKDSISNDEFLKQVTRMEIQYDFDKKEKAAEYEREQQRIIQENKIQQQGLYLKGLLILLLLLALFSLLYIRHNRLKAQYARIDLEQRLLRTQMNPHFIFNSLCAVQDLIMADKPQKANAFLTKISRLMRNILENSREEYVALDKEIETLKLYLDVQQLRFEEGFEYDINVDQGIDPENVSVPPMLAQPCVENSIEHGLLPAKEKGRVTVSYTLRDGLMMLEVTDNGVGRKQASEAIPRTKKQSLSTQLTQKRLEHFRKILKEKQISYEIIDLYDDGAAAGTKVIMMLPYRKIYA